MHKIKELKQVYKLHGADLKLAVKLNEVIETVNELMEKLEVAEEEK